LPVSYVIDKQNKLVVATVTGVLTLDEVLATRRQLMSDPDFDPSLSQLADLSAVTELDLTAVELKMLAETSPFSLTSRRAFVGERPEVYGLARMYSIMRGLRGDQEIHVFRTRDAALAWVLKKHKAA
jgi:hypothetical protein